MTQPTPAAWQQPSLLPTTALALLLASALPAQAQVTYQPGQRVECDSTGSGKWYSPGTIQPFQKGDFGSQEPDGSWYRFKADSNGVEYPCKPAFIRALAGGPAKTGEAPRADRPRQDKETAAAAGNFIACPVTQKPVNNGARPDAELFKRIVRCKKGEKAVAPGDEGAVGVEVSALQIGASRPWSYRQDIGNGKTDTVVYPVKATYTVKTFYRNATEVEEDWVRVLNFYVNAFGEWQIGSEEPVSSGRARRIPK